MGDAAQVADGFFTAWTTKDFGHARALLKRAGFKMDGTAPPRRRPTDLAGYLEALSRPVFQAGMNWRVIDAKWEGIRAAFGGFDPVTVAKYGPADVQRLLADPRVVRSKAKIEATIDNAQALLELDAEHGGFARYLRSLGGFAETVADLKRQFRFIGDSGAYHFLWSVNEPTPPYQEWFAGKQSRQQARPPHRTPATRRPASSRG